MKKYFLKNKLNIFVVILCNFIYVVAIGGMPFITKSLFDYDFTQDLGGIVWIVLLYLLCALIGMGAQYYTQTFGWKVERNFKISMKHDLFSAMTYYSYPTFATETVSSYVSTLENDVDVVVRQYVFPILEMIQQSTQVIVFAAYLFFLDYRLAIVIILASCLTVKIPDLTAGEFSKRKSDHQKGIGKYMTVANDLLVGFKAINHQTRQSIIKHHDETLIETEGKLYRFGTFKAFTLVLTGAAMYGVNIVSYGTLGVLFAMKQITKGQGAAALQYINDFGYPVAYLLECYGMVCSSRDVRNRLVEIINKKAVSKGSIHPTLTSKIELKNVRVEFEKFELGPINLNFEKGRKYALIGHSGSGKSTILSLLMQYIHLSEGQILVDGQPLQSIEASSLMLCLNQAEPLFLGSFEENVSVFGSYEISSLPDWINRGNCDRLTHVAAKENCDSLSGGEKQLVHLIKSLISQRDVLLLDESFSALDPQTKVKMYDLIYQLKDQLVISVTHDTSEQHLSCFDEVIVFSNGQLVAQGSYQSLSQNHLLNLAI